MNQVEMKELLKQAWKEVFDIEEVSDDADFFEDGGDSIKAVQLSAWLRQKGVKLDLGVIFSVPLLSQMAETLQETDPMYVPDKLMTKEMIREKYNEMMGSAPATSEDEDQICDPANNNELFGQQGNEDQICDPANNGKLFGQQGNEDQICDPANNGKLFGQQGNEEQICDPANNQQLFPVPGMMGGYMAPDISGTFDSVNLMYQMLQLMISQQQTMLQMMSMMTSMMTRQPVMQGSKPQFRMPPNGFGSNNKKGAKNGTEKAKEAQEWMNKYKSKKIDKPVEKPNVIGLNNVKVGKPEKSAEEVLEYVLSTVLKGQLDKDKDLFEQGLSSLDTVKMVTRCGEYGYRVNMQDIYMHSVFNELVKCLTPGE